MRRLTRRRWRVAGWTVAVIVLDALAVAHAATSWASEAVEAALADLNPEEGF